MWLYRSISGWTSCERWWPKVRRDREWRSECASGWRSCVFATDRGSSGSDRAPNSTATTSPTSRACLSGTWWNTAPNTAPSASRFHKTRENYNETDSEIFLTTARFCFVLASCTLHSSEIRYSTKQFWKLSLLYRFVSSEMFSVWLESAMRLTISWVFLSRGEAANDMRNSSIQPSQLYTVKWQAFDVGGPGLARVRYWSIFADPV